MRRIITLFNALLLVFILTGSIHATGLLTEDFNYTAGTLLSANGWTAHSGTGTNAITVTTTGGASGLTYTGYSGTAVGLSVTLAATGEDDNKLLSGAVTSGSIYFSAMIKVTSVTTAGYFFNIGTGPTTFYARLFVQASGGGYNFGITKGSGDAAQYESTVRTFGSTYFVVVKYTYGSTCAVYVNPTPLASEPASPTVSSLTAADIPSSPGITAVYIRQGSSGPILTLDGIRAGTTWADAAPTSGPAATFSITGALSAFSQTTASPGPEQSYTISGTGLTTNVTLAPPAGFEISKTTGSGFVTSTGSLVYTAAEVIAGKTIYVRMNSPVAGNYSGSITHTSTGSDFTPVNQSVSGTNTSPCVLTLTAFLEGNTNSGGTAMRNDHYPVTVTVELHNSSTFALVESKSGVLSSAGVGVFNFTTAVNGSPYYIVIKSANSVETWSATAQSFTSGALSYNFSTAAGQAYGSNMVLKGSTWCIYSGDVAKDATNIVDGSDVIAIDNDNTYGVTDNAVTDITGDGIVDGSDVINVDNNNTYGISLTSPSGIAAPVFSQSGTLTSFSQTTASASAEQTYTIGGTNLTANVTLAPPAGFEISKTTGSGFVTSSGSLVYSAAEVMAGKTIYVRLHAGSTGNYSGNITHTSGNSEFTQATKSVSGNYTLTPVFTITGTLSSFSQSSATPSAEQTYTIGGTNLTANVTLAPPAGFEISKTTGSGFVTSSGSFFYTAAEVMAGKTIYVRMNAPSSGNYSGSITHTSAGSEFTVQNKSVSGLYSLPSGNVNLTMGNPSGATTDINFPHNYLLDKPEFCASYDKDRGIPNWTSWQLNAAWITGPGVRRDNYIPDPEVPSAWYHVNDGDYSGSGFSRGHMCPSADRINTQAHNDSLFYYTNMIPQNQNNNGGTWEGLENYERTLAATNTVYIICGGYGAGGTKTDNSATVTTISNGNVTVPAQIWKVMIVVPNGSGDDVSRITTSTRTIAMIIPNNSVPNSASTWGNYRVSVDSIEALTGYDFFSNVSPAIQAVIESVVDSGPTN